MHPQAGVRAWRLIVAKTYIRSVASIEPLEVSNEFCFWPNLFQVESVAKPRMSNNQIGVETILAQSKRFTESSLSMQDSCFVTAQIWMTELTFGLTSELISDKFYGRHIISRPFFVLAKKDDFVGWIRC